MEEKTEDCLADIKKDISQNHINDDFITKVKKYVKFSRKNFSVVSNHNNPNSIYKIIEGGTDTVGYQQIFENDLEKIQEFNQNFKTIVSYIDITKNHQDIINIIGFMKGFVNLETIKYLVDMGLEIKSKTNHKTDHDLNDSVLKPSNEEEQKEWLINSLIGSNNYFDHELIDYLMKFYTKKELEQTAKQNFDMDPLHLACSLSTTETVEVLLNNGLKDRINKSSHFFNKKVYPLTTAIKMNNLQTVELLVDYGADLNQVDNDLDQGLFSLLTSNISGVNYADGLCDFFIKKGFNLNNDKINFVSYVFETHSINLLVKCMEYELPIKDFLNKNESELKILFDQTFKKANFDQNCINSLYEIKPFKEFLSFDDIRSWFFAYVENSELKNNEELNSSFDNKSSKTII